MMRSRLIIVALVLLIAAMAAVSPLGAQDGRPTKTPVGPVVAPTQAFIPTQPVQTQEVAPVTGAELDFSLDPSHGILVYTSSLRGFDLDVGVDLAGEVDTFNTSVGQFGCVGAAPVAPHFRLSIEATLTEIVITVEAPGDATLIVNNPNGEWLCADNIDVSVSDYNASLSIQNPPQGTYDIWGGTLAPGTLRPGGQNIDPGVLRISGYTQ